MFDALGGVPAGLALADVGRAVAGGNIVLAVAIAAAAGLVSFASPCVLPLVPGFLGYVTGLGGPDSRARTPARRRRPTGRGPLAATTRRTPSGAAADRSRVVAGAALFVLGFSVVFLAAMVLATSFGLALIEYRRQLQIAGGVLVIALALVFLGVGGQRTLAPNWRPRAGLWGAPLLGAIFAIGWTPCSGPTLGVISVLAATDSPSLGRGLALGAAYCLGLGVPFLLLASGWSRAVRVSAWLRRHQRLLHSLGGALLLVVGLLLVTGWWDILVTELQRRLVGGFEVPL